MPNNFTHFLLLGLAPFALLTASQAHTEELIEQSAEYRYQLDFHVPDAALAKFLPDGWEPSIAEAGNAKDANLRLIFIDRLAVLDGEQNSIGAGATQMAYLAIPVKQTEGDLEGQMIIAGLTGDAESAPGPFGVYQHAVVASMDRAVTSVGGRGIVDENWAFAAPTGEHFEMHIKYERAPTRTGGRDTMFFDPNDPAKHLIFRPSQGIDIGRNVTTMPRDRVMEFTYRAGGGRIAELFDGTERVLSWDSFPWYNLEILSPD